MHFYNNVAELRHFRGAWAPAAPNAPGASAAAAEHLDVEVADFLAQCVAVDPEQVGGPDLIAARGRERHRQQRVLDLAQDAVVQTGRPQRIPEAREIGSQ